MEYVVTLGVNTGNKYIYCLGLPAFFKTTPCLLSVVICIYVPGTNGGSLFA